MNLNVQDVLLLAKNRYLAELEQLSTRSGFVETIGDVVHHLQAERGASCLYLASNGKQFSHERAEIIAHNALLTVSFKKALNQHLESHSNADSKQLTLVSWILLGLDQLKSLRHKVTTHQINFPDCFQSYTRLINCLISMIFEISDTSVNSKVSAYLVALYNLVQAKEFAGQERAVGSFMFGSGNVDATHQEKLIELINCQDRQFEQFQKFAGDQLECAFHQVLDSPTQKALVEFRHKLTRACPNKALLLKDGDAWFQICSERLEQIWQIQCGLIKQMHDTLEHLHNIARQDLSDTQQYLVSISHHQTPTSSDASFFNLSLPIEHAFSFLAHESLTAYPVETIISLLQQQTQQIAHIETELIETKKALAERKQIERAKGIIMHEFALSEVEAYKRLRTMAMDQNRKIGDVAENILQQTKKAITTH